MSNIDKIRELNPELMNIKRFMIMTILYLLRRVTESDLCKILNISWGSLYTHLKRLEEIGYVKTRKCITDKGVRTIVEITSKGYEEYRKFIEVLKNVIDMLS